MAESVDITGRTPVPLTKKLNPLWWFGNDDDPPPPGFNAWTWFLRNPMHNFTFYVIGVADKNYTVKGSPDVANLETDIGKVGWNWSVIQTTVPLPYVGYSKGNFQFYAGWQPNGKLGFKLTW